jgi:peptidoglycan/LPS O-acetylase OafA/YrhL
MFETYQTSVPESSPALFTFRHFPQLDGLRGFAILLVIVCHLLQFDSGMHVGGSGGLGGLGVLLFFVLSGFLITGLLDREKRQTGRISLSAFYIRRVLRLFPALFCFLAVLVLLIVLGIVTDTSWRTLAACLVYVRNLKGQGYSTAHIWSLSIEEQFYLFWPCIMRLVDRAKALRIAAAGVLAVSVFRMVGIHWQWGSYDLGAFYERSWYRFDSMLIGCAIALILSQSVRAGKLRTYLSSVALPVALWPAILAWTLWGESVSQVWYLTVQTIFASLILFNLVLAKESLYLRIFSNPLMGWLGRISYSWYLWQQLFTVFTSPAWHGLRTFPTNVAASLLIAVASQRFVERPFLRMKDRLGQRQRIDAAAELRREGTFSWPREPHLGKDVRPIS